MITNSTIEIKPGLSAQRIPMNSLRKTSLTVGVLYLLTFISISTLTLYGPIHESNYILGSGNDNSVITGGLLEIIVGLSGIATAIILYPVLRKQHQGAALGLVASRIVEAGTMFMGVAFLLAVVSLRQQEAGAGALNTSHALVALYDRIFLLGQGFMPALNDLLLGYLLYKSRLVPRTLAVIGMAGALPLIAGYTATMFGVIERISPLAGLSAIPVAVFEFSLGIYLVVKGFRPSPVTESIQYK